MTDKNTSWESVIKLTDISPPYSAELEKGTFSPDSDRLNSSTFFKPFMNENLMANLDYDMREVKSRLDVFYSDNADLKAEIKVSNANTKRIMDDINELTHSTETNASNITDIKNTLSEFKSETNLNFANITNEFSKVRAETRSEFEKVRTETASQFVDVNNAIALNFEKTKTIISESETKFGDKLRVHMTWTIGTFLAVSALVFTLNYRANGQLETKFNKLEVKVESSVNGINDKLDVLLAAQAKINSGTTALNKSEPVISITKAQMQAVIVEAIQEAEQSKLDNDIAMLDTQINKAKKKVQ
jgi:hypothetical protein